MNKHTILNKKLHFSNFRGVKFKFSFQCREIGNLSEFFNFGYEKYTFKKLSTISREV